jgi:precorrin-3B methylase
VKLSDFLFLSDAILCSAGNSGVAILLYEPKHQRRISTIERESGVKFEHMSAPQPADIAQSAGSEAAEAITNVSDRSDYSSVQIFYLCALEVFTFAVLSGRR